MLSRRRFGQLALAAMPLDLAFGKINSVVHGVQFGLQTYSFNGTPRQGVLDVVTRCMVEAALGEVDIWAPLIEPPELTGQRAELANWRATAPLDYFHGIRRKFEDRGIEVMAFSTSAGSSDVELNRTLEITKALGAKIATVGAPLTILRRLAPIADQHGVMIGIQGNPRMNSTNPDQVCRPEQYDEALSISKNFRVSLDVGDAVGGGWTDVLQFVKDHHTRIFQLYLKDRNKANVTLPWGEGDTPLKQILLAMRDNRYAFRAYIDNDYKSPLSRSDDVKRSFEYAKAVLAG